MSSDYIPRLRAELVRAAERKQSPWRRAVPPLRPLIAAAAVALVVVAVVVAVDRGGSGSDELEYTVAAGSAEQAAEVMRERLEAGGVRGATVSVGSDGRLAIDAPPESRRRGRGAHAPGRVRDLRLGDERAGARRRAGPGRPGGDRRGRRRLRSGDLAGGGRGARAPRAAAWWSARRRACRSAGTRSAASRR